MTLAIWSTTAPQKVLSALSPALKAYSDQPIRVAPELSQITALQPRAVFALGKEPLDTLQLMGIAPKNRKITSLREVNTLKLPNGTPVRVSYSPGIGDVDHGMYITLLTDTALAARLAFTGSLKPKTGEYRYVTSFDAMCERIREIHQHTGKTVDVCLDLETVGKDEYALPLGDHPGAYVVSLQISCEVGRSHVMHIPDAVAEARYFADMEHMRTLSWLLSCPFISMRGANLKYDLRWLWARAALTCTNYRFDTTLVGNLLDENRSNGLKTHVKIYAPDLGGYEASLEDGGIDIARMDKALPNDELLVYTGGDTDGCLRVANAMKAELLQDSALSRFYVNVLHPAARAFEVIERGGVFVDREKFRELEADLNTEAIRLVHEAKKILGGRFVAKYGDDTKAGGMNITSPTLIKDYMFSQNGLNLKPLEFTPKPNKKTGQPVPACGMEHLEKFKKDPQAAEFIACLREYASVTKTLGTYVTGFLKCLRSDGKFHPSYWFFVGDRDAGEGGTNTGRLSCKDPAFQCMTGDALVNTDKGPRRIDWLVEHDGAGLHVLTHTGSWRPIVGTYRNGVRPVFELTFSNGSVITCTGNHPVLTADGWTRTDQLQPGATAYADKGYGTGTPHAGLYKPDILFVDRYEESLSFADVQGLEKLRRAGGYGVRALAQLRNFPSGHGRKTGGGVVDRTQRHERQLRTGELRLGVAATTNEQPTQYDTDYAQRLDEDRSTVGARSRHIAGTLTLPVVDWDVDGASLEEGNPVNRAVFEEVTLLSIVPAGNAETFDLTIQSSHSFVANGIAVHNTIPKHTVWAKRIRECYPAPPGYLIGERDYSQGELKVVACIANEQNMIQSYRDGLDLHVVTSARFAGYEYDEMIAWSKMDEKSAEFERYENTRQLGKAGNFGLLYGMGVEGFMEYAENNYGVALTYAQAEAFRNSFFASYPGLVKYHTEYKGLAKRFGMVRSPLGRIRHLPLIKSTNSGARSLAERQSINSPVQGTLSDMLSWSFAEMMAQQPEWYEQRIIMPFGAIHDAAYDYIAEDRAQEVAKYAINVMQNLPFNKVGWNPQLNFTADLKLGANMGNLKKVKF